MRFRINKTQLERVAKKYRLRFVILHGSRATGSARADSDVDIAVLAKTPMDFQKQVDLFGELEGMFTAIPHRELDLKTLHGVDPLFRYEVTRDGVLLYGDPTAYEDFKAFSLRAYEDAQPLFALEKILIERYQKHLNQLAVST